MINEYFCEVGEKLNLALPRVMEDISVRECGKIFDWGGRIKVEEVAELLNEINIGKSSGMPEISSKLVKHFLTLFIDEFTDLVADHGVPFNSILTISALKGWHLNDLLAKILKFLGKETKSYRGAGGKMHRN